MKPRNRSTVVVRPYRIEDTDEILRLFHETVHRVNARDYSPEQIAAWAIANPDRSAWERRMTACTTSVAEHDGTIVGFCEFEADGHINCFYVHADWIGKGVGSRLLDHVFSLARAANIERLSTEASITARPFFERKGFTTLHPRTVELRGVEMTNYTMEYQIETCWRKEK